MANASKGLLVAHRHNGDGNRTDVQQVAVHATTTSVENEAGQYSDHVTLKATISPATAEFGTISGNVAFTVNGVAAGSAPVDSSGVATLDYQILLGAGSYGIGASFNTTNPNFVSSTGSGTLTVSREDAVVALSAGNPESVKVNAPGGTAGTVTLAATITEVGDGSLGNICLAAPVAVAMVPVGPGSTINGTAAQVSCDGTTLQVSATFSNVPVNVYDVAFTIGGNYYTGSAHSVLAVFDPSLGNLTGGGTVIRNGVRANFGLNVKYLKNGGAQGSVIYIEHRPTGDLVIKGTAMKSLSIVGNTAILLTKNAIANGVGGYNLRMVAVDNGEPGKTDKIGVTAYDTTNAVVPGIDYSAAPVTISGGNIAVPHVN